MRQCRRLPWALPKSEQGLRSKRLPGAEASCLHMCLRVTCMCPFIPEVWTVWVNNSYDSKFRQKSGHVPNILVAIMWFFLVWTGKGSSDCCRHRPPRVAGVYTSLAVIEIETCVCPVPHCVNEEKTAAFWLARDILLFKEFDSGAHLELSFVKLSVVQTPSHREQTFCWRGQVQENFWMKSAAESSLVLIRLKPAPDHAHSWADFKAQH